MITTDTATRTTPCRCEARPVEVLRVVCAACTRPDLWRPGSDVVVHDHGACFVRGGR